MKQNTILTALLLAAAPVWAQTVVSTSFTNDTPASIADGNPVGTTEQIAVSGISGTVTNVQVQLDITGGFNGDLYTYLVDPTGQMAVLLNRSGVDGSNPSGYGNAGFNITLSGAATNDVHYYQAITNGGLESLQRFERRGREWNVDAVHRGHGGGRRQCHLGELGIDGCDRARTADVADARWRTGDVLSMPKLAWFQAVTRL